MKWWLLAIPHYLIVGCLPRCRLDGYVGQQPRVGLLLPGGHLIGLMVLIAAADPAVHRPLPEKPIYDFVLGMNRWVFRVAAYPPLMTDRLPAVSPRHGQRGAGAAGTDAVGPTPAPGLS